jgi:hypothetical protein
MTLHATTGAWTAIEEDAELRNAVNSSAFQSEHGRGLAAQSRELGRSAQAPAKFGLRQASMGLTELVINHLG